MTDAASSTPPDAPRYDSRPDTLKHIDQVQQYLGAAVRQLTDRAIQHDLSKLSPPEVSIFDEFTPKLKDSTYNSVEYRQFLQDMRPALEHHYTHNSHHPEHHDQWQCPTCERTYTRANVPSPGFPDSSHRWCQNCHNGAYPGYHETSLILQPGIDRMGMLDLLEMLCDWKAASLRHADGDLRQSIETNQTRFQYSDEMKNLLLRTAQELQLL